MSDAAERTMGGPIWWIFVARGLFAGALGIFALFWPSEALSVLVLLVGLYLIADGVMGLVLASRRPPYPGRLLQPVVSVVAGLVLALWPGESARTLFVILGIAVLLIGISYLVTARRFGLDAMDRRLMTSAGAVAAVLGVVLIIWPGAMVVILSWIVAFAALAMAALFLYQGVRFKQVQARVEMMPPRGPTDGAGPWR